MFTLDEKSGYFRNQGVDVMAFDDIYPSGHQSGISVIMHGQRLIANGDLRFEPTPGQWQPTPKQTDRVMSAADNSIVTTLQYPDQEGNLRGFNPLLYPDYEFSYTVSAKSEGEGIRVRVDLDKEIPAELVGKLSFNLELFPGVCFGKYWMTENESGIFPRQANGPVMKRESVHDVMGIKKPLEDAKGEPAHLKGQQVYLKDSTQPVSEYQPILADDLVAEPLASGKEFTICPDAENLRVKVSSDGEKLSLYDGRMNHNNGWFVLVCPVKAGTAQAAVDLLITPNVIPDWRSKPVVQISQVGYHPDQPKKAVIELDRNDMAGGEASLPECMLYQITAVGKKCLGALTGRDFGRFLRYHYLIFDFSDVKEEGLYQIAFGEVQSNVFRIAKDIYDRGVWQPVLEYFLPVQMCHMRVNEKYRVWHGLCHNDDALMAPVNLQHFDGYVQGPSTLTKYAPMEKVPGLNAGGWHDAGDFDLRIESQAGEVYNLALIYDTFHVEYDATTVDQATKTVEIHQPDGKNDILQQIEHGLLTVVGGYESLGRLYRGIITGKLREYVLLGDPSNMTPGDEDGREGRWVFTEDNPGRELTTAAQLACAAKVMRDYDAQLAERSLKVAVELFEKTPMERAVAAKLHAAMELFLCTEKEEYRSFILEHQEEVLANLRQLTIPVCRLMSKVEDPGLQAAVRKALMETRQEYDRMSMETPYGIPYRPHIWGAGWGIQGMGVNMYFVHKAFPEAMNREMIFDALHFVLGCHPGSNTASFASGVGVKSATVAYGMNRADWSYIPGGVISGTGLIRPDFPELLEFPYLWQQGEYVMGGGSSNYMFLVLACADLLK